MKTINEKLDKMFFKKNNCVFLLYHRPHLLLHLLPCPRFHIDSYWKMMEKMDKGDWRNIGWILEELR